MKGNQALEALANICGGEVPPTENNNSNSASSSSNNNNGAQQQPANLASQHQALIQAAQQQLSQQSQQHSHQHQLPALTAQQVQQALAALQGSSGVGSNNNNNPASALSFLFGAGVPQAHSQPSAAPAAAAAPMGIEQLAYFQLLQQAQQQQRGVAVSPEQQALLMALQTGAFSRANPATTSAQGDSNKQVIPQASSAGTSNSSQAKSSNNGTKSSSSTTTAAASSASSSSSTMNPPPPPALAGSLSSVQSSLHAAANIAPMPKQPPQRGGQILPSGDARGIGEAEDMLDDKKQIKRAANRRSAQLSRKRKKQYIEELKEENDELRRKEQILKSIPDLIVVFDSSGKLWFVSQSVTRFIDMTPKELEGSSFWNRLCEDSVRLLKAAFMDSLAARKNNEDTAPLGSGVWELRLVDKDGSYKVVTLSGVVHFTGDTPECVCCIRPREAPEIIPLPKGKRAKTTAAAKHQPRAVSSSDGSRSSDNSSDKLQIHIKSHQSVLNGDASSEDSGTADDRKAAQQDDEEEGSSSGTNGIRISDGDTGSVSESDDGVTSN